MQKLRANYFELISTGKWCLYQYRVDFSPEDDNTGRKKRLMRDGMRNVIPGGYLFDGSLMFTPVRLQNDPLEVVVQGESKGVKKFYVLIKILFYFFYRRRTHTYNSSFSWRCNMGRLPLFATV